MHFFFGGGPIPPITLTLKSLYCRSSLLKVNKVKAERLSDLLTIYRQKNHKSRSDSRAPILSTTPPCLASMGFLSWWSFIQKELLPPSSHLVLVTLLQGEHPNPILLTKKMSSRKLEGTQFSRRGARLNPGG